MVISSFIYELIVKDILAKVKRGIIIVILRFLIPPVIPHP